MLDRKRKIAVAEGGDEVPKPAIRLPQGAIQAAVLDVLGSASGALRPVEIHARVQQRLSRPVTRDTVTSFLSVACRDDRSPVTRLDHGRYTTAR